MRRKSFLALTLAMVSVISACGGKSDENVKEDETKDEVVSSLESIKVDGGEKDKYNFLYLEKSDGSRATSDEVTKLSDITGVDYTQMYGTSNHVEYFINEGVDYLEGESGVLDLYPTGMYVRSEKLIGPSDIEKGNLPENKNEIVIYSEDESILGKTVKMYLFDYDYLKYNHNGDEEKMDVSDLGIYDSGRRHEINEGAYAVEREMKVVGILKEKTNQIYFDEGFCDEISIAYAGFIYADVIMSKAPGTKESGIEKIPGTLKAGGTTKIGMNENMDSMYYGNLDWGENISNYIYFDSVEDRVLVIKGEDCEKNEIRIAENLRDYNNNTSVDSSLYPLVMLKYMYYPGYNMTCPETDGMGYFETEDTLGIDGKGFYNNRHDTAEKRGLYSSLIATEISDKYHKSGEYVLEAGDELFNRLYCTDESYEVAVLLKEDCDEGAFLEEAGKLGFKKYEKKTSFDIHNYLYDGWSLLDLKTGETVTDKNYMEYEK